MGLRDNDKSLREDERAIEGLPIRLVIALFVGVAALGLMLQVLGIFDEDQLSTDEANIVIEQGEAVGLDNIGNLGPDDPVVQFRVQNGNGETLTSVDRVLVGPDTAQGETITVAVNNGTGTITKSQLLSESQAHARLRPDQNEGAFEIRILDSDESNFDQVNEGAFTILS